MSRTLYSPKSSLIASMLLSVSLSSPVNAKVHHDKTAVHPRAASAAIATPASAPVDTDIPASVWNDPAWQQGPKTVQLGNVASLVIPAGFRFLPAPPATPEPSAASAATVQPDDQNGQEDKDAQHDSDDEPSIAMLAPEDGSWLMKVVLSRSGYVNSDYINLNPDGLARTMEVRANPAVPGMSATDRFSTSENVTWIRPPHWDGKEHELDWLYENMEITKTAINSTTYMNAMKLGRRYSVAMQIEMDDSKAKDRAIKMEDTFGRLIGGLNFNSGEAYADYRPGDPKASLKLVDFITGPETEANKEFDDKVARATGFDWSGFAGRILPVLSLGLLGLGVASRKKRARQGEDAK